MPVFYRRLPRFRYLAPKTLDEAILFLADHGTDAMPMAGGTDLIPNLKRREIPSPAYVLDLKRIPNLGEISFDPRQGLSIGALATIRSISQSNPVRDFYPALAQAASSMASPQVRNRGTFVGNICSAVPSADSAPPLLALDAKVQARGPNGERTIPLERFLTGSRKTALQADEIVTFLSLPIPPKRNIYLKLSPRHSMDLAIVGVAAAANMDRERPHDIRITLGAVAPTAMRAGRAEELLRDRPVSSSVIEEAAYAASAECQPVDDYRASAAYRRDMVYVLTKRALERILTSSGD